MKKWFAVAFISTYLGALSWGIFAHAVQYMQTAHPAMYYLVWDMFCGWSAFSNRYHVIAEGESGEWYELAPGPWGGFEPYGNIARQHYDTFSAHLVGLGMNTLRHTEHEPITRIFCVEETWAKKYNMSEDLWRLRYGTEKPPFVSEITGDAMAEFGPSYGLKPATKYHRVRRVYAGDGTPLHRFTSWYEYQHALVVSDNPRLIADMKRGKSFYAPTAKWMPQVQEMDALNAPQSLQPSAPHAN